MTRSFFTHKNLTWLFFVHDMQNLYELQVVFQILYLIFFPYIIQHVKMTFYQLDIIISINSTVVMKKSIYYSKNT